MYLYLDTTDFNRIIFGFRILKKNKIKKQYLKIKPNESFKTVFKLEQFLRKHKLPITQIKVIYVNKGPGSFVGTRVGVTMAQALGLALGAKTKTVEKKKMEELL